MAAISRRSAAVRAGAEAGCTDTDTGPEDPLTEGQPRKETTALASTKRMAAPASSDPAVPKPAIYARVARTSVRVIGSSRTDL
jgi:hypothetical protein